MYVSVTSYYGYNIAQLVRAADHELHIEDREYARSGWSTGDGRFRPSAIVVLESGQPHQRIYIVNRGRNLLLDPTTIPLLEELHVGLWCSNDEVVANVCEDLKTMFKIWMKERQVEYSQRETYVSPFGVHMLRTRPELAVSITAE